MKNIHVIPKEEPKQETLEEAKQRILDFNYMTKNDADIFEMGVKWQEERSYSIEELRLWLVERDIYLHNYYTTYKKSGIPKESIDDYIKDSHEYLMNRKQLKKINGKRIC